jgi:PHD/YefM family antitoxin component YafN of YafNO toxin-antitoxin module
MSIQKLESSAVQSQWRELLVSVGTGRADVIVMLQGEERAAIIPYQDYVALRDELVQLRAYRRQALDALAIDSALDRLMWEEQLDDDDGSNYGSDDGDGGGGDGGDGGE